jgi:hypothetical protein
MQQIQNATLQNTTLISFVEQNCDNYLSDECYGSLTGKCIGGDVNGGRLKRKSQTVVIYQDPIEFLAPNTGECWIQEGIPCDYFKKRVLSQNGYSAIDEEYREMCSSVKEQEPRLCECGATLAKRERYCAKCKVINRKKAYRKYNRNRMAVVPQLT